MASFSRTLLAVCSTLFAITWRTAAASDDDTVQAMIRQRLERNPAWQRAQKDPPFSLNAPAGFVTDEAEKKSQRAAADALWKRMQAARAAGTKTFVVPPGNYRFANNRGLTLAGWTNFTIEARGACFWFERPADQLAANPQGLSLHRCRNVQIRGLTIDFDPPVYIQARIEQVAADGSQMTARIDPAWPRAPVGAGQFSVYKPDGAYVPQHLFRHEGADLGADGLLHIKVDVRGVQDNFNTNYLAYTGGRGRIAPGDLIALNFRRGHSLGVFDSEAITFEDLNIYQSPGMGILESQGQGGNTYRGIRMIRRPGTRRVHYGTADHFHSNRILNGAQIIGCEFAHSSDDNVNLHGNWAYVWRQIDPTTVVLGAPDAPPVGNRLTMYDRVELTVKAEAKVVSVAPLKDPALLEAIAKADVPQKRIAQRSKDALRVVRLDRPVTVVPHQLADLHLNYENGFRIQDCYFHDSRSRGILLSGACNGNVVNNLWINEVDGISIYEESWGYAEGPIPARITILGNLVLDCGGVVPSGGIHVGLVPGGRQGLRKTRPISGIRIEENLLVNTGFLTVLYTDGGTVRNNILVEPLHYFRFTGDFGRSTVMFGQGGYFPRPRRSPISIWSSRDIEVSGNQVYWSGAGEEKDLVDVGDFAENIRLGTNRIFRLAPHKGMLQIPPK